MIVQIVEQLYNYCPSTYFVETDKLDSDNPIDKRVLESCEKEDFNPIIFIDIDKERENDPENEFWEDPMTLTRHLKAVFFERKIEDSIEVEKLIQISIYDSNYEVRIP